jgi:undecaprenyl-diphosphatase
MTILVAKFADHILQLHGAAALAVVFLLPALESSAFVGFIFPGEIAVLLGGVLASQHRVSLGAVIAAAVVGAVVGDAIGYVVGRRYGRRLLEGSVGRIVKRHHLDAAERYLRERGGKAVFFGRFTAALRVLVPGLAGMSGMRYSTFAAYNVAGGAVWAVAFVLLGYAAGDSWRRIESVAKRASLVLLGLAVAGAVITVAVRWVLRHRERLGAAHAAFLRWRPVAVLVARFRRQIDFLVRRLDPGGALGLSLTGSLVLLGAAGWALGVVIQDVAARDDIAGLDRPVLDFFVRHREPWLTSFFKTVSLLGSSELLVPLVIVAGIAWRVRRTTWRPLGMLASAYLGSALLFRVVKALTGRLRPPSSLAIGHFTGLAFPSGHATQAIAVWGMLAAIAAACVPAWRTKVLLWTAALVIAGIVGVSRIYLGAHWLTDVLGGWAGGALWLVVLLTTVRTVAGLRTGRVADRMPA